MLIPMFRLKLPPHGAARLFCAVLLGSLSIVASAQQTASLSPAEANLPDAPGMGFFGQEGETPAQLTGSISGMVLDINEGLVPDAHIALIEEGRPGERTTVSDSEGNFTFPNLPPGRFKLTITSPGLETFVSSEIQLRPDERYSLPKIALPLAAANISVQVTVTEVEIAEEQVHLQEKQRVLGILPNFYTSYIWDAAPLNTRQKFGLATHSIFDPVIFLATGAAAGFEQYRGTFPAYGPGPQGYAQRYAADYGDEVSSRMFSSAIYPSIFHQDPRYFYKGSGSKRSRFFYAITRAVVTRGDNGQQQPNYSRILGAFTAGALSNAYHLGDDRGAGLTFRNSSIAIGGHAADNLLREFLFKRFTPKIPDYEKGEPLNDSPTK